MGEEKRHQMMQNLFGDQSEEEEEEEEEIDSEHESNPQPNYASDEAEGELRNDDRGEGEVDIDGDIEGREYAEVENEEQMGEVEPDPGESEGEREVSLLAVDGADQREESDLKDTESDEKEDYGHRVVTSRRRDVIESESERFEDQHYADQEDEEVDQATSPSNSPYGEKNHTHVAHSAAEIRDVFGDSDDEEETGYAAQDDIERDSNRSPMEEEESYEKNLRPEDMLADEDARYESEEDVDVKPKEKPVGPPLEIDIPFLPPPAPSNKMHLIKVSNIMGIDPKEFDPKTYVEEKNFITDESGGRRPIRLEHNIVRWRTVKNHDGATSVESNARFVRWSDGSLQLLIGNEVLDVSEQDAQHDQMHLFLRHNKSLLQSQGRILKKMKFMPSSLSSKSHRLLTALVDSRHRKVYKVKNCITIIDPEKEKEEKEKAESQTIRANVFLNRKKEKVSRKYTQPVEHRRQLSPGFLEGALDEDDEPDYFDSHHSRRHFEDLEVEARAEKRIMNAKKGHKDILHKSSLSRAKSSNLPVTFSDSERDVSEYESDGNEDDSYPPHKGIEEPEQEYEEEEDEHYIEEAEVDGASEEDDYIEEPKQKAKDYGGGRKRAEIESDEESPPRKNPPNRRKAVVFDSDDE